MTVEEISSEFIKAQTRHDSLKLDLERRLNKILDDKAEVANMTKARWVLTEVATATQKRFKETVENLVTMAIKAVFSRPFEFHLEFERKRNKMECRPEIQEVVNGKRRVFDPSDEMGGGIVDIISFALKIVMWNLESPKSRNVMIFDEPMKNLGQMVSLAGQVLKEISHRLNFQLIIVTHEEELIEIADRAYRISHDGNKSAAVLAKGDIIEALKRVRIARG